MTFDTALAPPQLALGIAVPASIFAPERRPTFMLLDEIGDPAHVDRTWMEECAGETVYLAPDDATAFRDYLRLYLRDIMTTDEVPLMDRAWAVQLALAHEVAFLYAGGGPRPRPNTLTTICRELATFLLTLRSPDALFQGVRGHSAYTPAIHGVETAIGATAIAIANGQRVRDQLAILAASAAFADIGMLDLPREIHDRPGSLTPAEWKAIQWHPDLSLRRMRALGITLPAAQRGVLHHHERWDGDGYPDRLAGEAIPIEARYIAIADTYSALTVAQRGRERLSRGDALREMARSTGQFDPHLLRILVHLLSGRTAEAAAPVAA